MAVHPGMMTIFTPSFADEADTNAQNLTVKEIVVRLRPDRYRVIMFCEGTPDPRIANLTNVRLLRWHGHGNTLRALAHCLRERPQVYFYPREGPLDAAFLQVRRRLGLRTAVVVHVVSGGMYNGALRPTLARNIREADAVFGNCNYLAELVRERCHVEAGTIHNGIDRRFFFPANVASPRPRKEPLTVLFAGSLRPYKRVDLLVHHAARWPQERFRIIGRGEEEQACRGLAERMGCRNVTFVGHLNLQQLGEEMRQADIFFFPSVLEGHPQVLGQAAACGLPCVAMNVYRPDYVVNGVTGFLAESDEKLGQRLDLLLSRPDLRGSFSAAASIHARQFDWDKITERWQEAFENALAKRGKH